MRFALGLAAVLALLGCQSNTDRYPPPPPCTGTNCDTGSPGSHTTGPDGGMGGGGGAGGSASVDQSGTVHRILSPDFADTTATPYTGAATIHAFSHTGAALTAPYGGTTGTTFTIQGLPSGDTWFEVEDTTPGGGSGVISTFSFATVPVAGNFVLPIVDLGTLQNIANTLPTVSVTGVSSTAAQVVIVVRHGTGYYQGLSVTGGTAGGKIAYDSGNGVYTDSATTTGSAGTVIVFNAALSGTANITLTDSTAMKSWTVPVQAGPGIATLAYVDLE